MKQLSSFRRLVDICERFAYKHFDINGTMASIHRFKKGKSMNMEYQQNVNPAEIKVCMVVDLTGQLAMNILNTTARP